MVKHDWISLKNQFVTEAWLTVSDFFRDKRIKDNSRSRLHTRGWITEKRTYQEEAAKRTRERIIENETDFRIRQQKLTLQLQMKGLRGLRKLPIKNAEDARKLILTGLEQEREILGIRGEPDANLTQVNVSLPKTRFDEILESQDFEGILKFIAEIKKERKRRSEQIVEKQ